MTGLDLSSIAQFVEGFILLDTIRFTTPAAGKPVFDPATGRYTYPEGDLIYEGPGAVQVSGTPGGISALPVVTQPWSDETTSKYIALTPLSAPIAERDSIVTVVTVHAGGDLALIGRQWRVQDPSNAATISVVRITGLDQIQQTREASS
ncbi:DUF6093 family protein [Streptomyces sp. NPDC048521]|uniref:DUF6093 family protein n=1 Tax=Streptomyces sp. NPDC048521 TaxID=3365566 RepID=UPI003723A728